MKKPKWRVSFRFNKKFYSWFNYYINKELLWKDKFETPRCEMEPKYLFSFLWFQIDFIQGNDDDWEWWLWVTKYNNNNQLDAKFSWGWGNRDENGIWHPNEPWLKYNK